MANGGERPNMNALIEASILGSRIPDTIKQLPTYSGDKKQLTTWIDLVQSTLELYRELVNTPIYPIWLRQIRQKITEKANDVLVNNHTPLQWNAMRDALIDHFGDRRDLSTLTQKIPYLKQGSQTIDSFYHECAGLASDINANLTLDPQNNGHVPAIMRVIGIMMRDSFIDGLHEPYSSYTRNARPASLLEARQYAVDQFAAGLRKREKFGTTRSTPQPKPPMRNANSYTSAMYRPPNYSTQNIYSKPAFQPNHFKPPVSNPPKVPLRPQPKPTPMDVDRSIRSNQVNYVNRQNHLPYKDHNQHFTHFNNNLVDDYDQTAYDYQAEECVLNLNEYDETLTSASTQDSQQVQPETECNQDAQFEEISDNEVNFPVAPDPQIQE